MNRTPTAPIADTPIPSALSPTAAQIKAARKHAGLTGAEAAGLVHSSDRSWRKWENGERKMHAAFWELFQIKAAATPHRSKR